MVHMSDEASNRINSTVTEYRDYCFGGATQSHMHRYLLPPLITLCGTLLKPGARILDVGCGNGFIAGTFLRLGCDVTGIDLSQTGVALARKSYPTGRFEIVAADDNIMENLGSG